MDLFPFRRLCASILANAVEVVLNHQSAEHFSLGFSLVSESMRYIPYAQVLAKCLRNVRTREENQKVGLSRRCYNTANKLQQVYDVTGRITRDIVRQDR